MQVLVYQGSNEQYRWRLVGDDGVMVSQSELFETVEEALEAAQVVADQNEAEIENRVVGETE